MSSASHLAGPNDRRAQKTVNRAPIAAGRRYPYNLHSGLSDHFVSSTACMLCCVFKCKQPLEAILKANSGHR